MISDMEIKYDILDSVSEDAYGSWKLWWGVSQKTEKGSDEREEVRQRFVDIVEKLVLENKLITLAHKEKGDIYTKISFDRSQLEKETRMAETEMPSTDIFYWFETTDAGWNEYDLMARKKFGKTEITTQELAEIRRRCELTTAGPWRLMLEGRDHTSGSNFIMTGTFERRGEDIELTGATVADQDFIAHAKQDIPRLLDEIDRLHKLNNKHAHGSNAI